MRFKADQAILLDTNLLLLLIVGLASESYIAKHKRLDGFNISDFEFLEDIVSSATKLVVTPNILTETSNLLSGGLREPACTDISESFSALINNDGVEEMYVRSRDVLKDGNFLQLGLSDNVSLGIASPDVLVLTTDRPLYEASFAQDRNVSFWAVNQD